MQLQTDYGEPTQQCHQVQSPQDGRIDTYTEELSCENGTVWYEFTITDTGVGMSEAFVKNELFRPFTQEKSDARTQYKAPAWGCLSSRSC